MFFDKENLVTADVKGLTVCLVGGKLEHLQDVARIGSESGWMVIEFVDGRQKIYNSTNIISIEEKLQIEKKKAV